MVAFILYLTLFYDWGGTVYGCVRGPTSEMISRWQDQTMRMASGVPMPAARGSPAGPNQWFWGAPVVRARMPVYVVPLIVSARIYMVQSETDVKRY